MSTILIIIGCVQVNDSRAFDQLKHNDYDNNNMQKIISVNSEDTSTNPLNDVELKDTIYMIPGKMICKNQFFVEITLKSTMRIDKVKQVEIKQKQSESKLIVSGYVNYDLYYRSYIDTPYTESNIYQHTLTAGIKLLYKNQYPIKLLFILRHSNSKYFRNFMGINFAFDPQEYRKLLDQKIRSYVKENLSEIQHKIDSLENLLLMKRVSYSNESTGDYYEYLKQRIVDEKERELSITESNKGESANKESNHIPEFYKSITFGKGRNFQLPPEDNSIYDSTITIKKSSKIDSLTDELSKQKNKIDSLKAELMKIQSLLTELKQLKQGKEEMLSKKALDLKKGNSNLERHANNNVPDSILPKGYKFFSGLKKLNIGRSLIDFSPLTARNITISGFQIQHHDRYYMAFAAGTLSYQFREYMIPALSKPKQHLEILRVGKGEKTGNHIHFTGYTGQRAYFNQILSVADSGKSNSGKLAGYAMHFGYVVSKKLFLQGEFAKSSLPMQYVSSNGDKRQTRFYGINNFSSRENEAYKLQADMNFPSVKAKFNAGFQYTGNMFQSFSFWNTGSRQLNWYMRYNQSIAKSRINYSASISREDQNTPYTTVAYKTSAVLANFQASASLKKNFRLGAGFFPAYQLLKSENQTFSEMRYYTLYGNAVKSFKTGIFQHISMLSISKFFNGSPDSGFIYYQADNLMASHHTMTPKITVGLVATFSRAHLANLGSIEGQFSLRPSSHISVGGNLKYLMNPIKSQYLLGFGIQAGIKIKFLGELSISADKAFLPNRNQMLVANEFGRLTFMRTF